MALKRAGTLTDKSPGSTRRIASNKCYQRSGLPQLQLLHLQKADGYAQA